MIKLIILNIVAAVGLAFNVKAQGIPRCNLNELTLAPAPENSGDFEDVRSIFRYIRLSKMQKRCITVLSDYKSSNSDGWVREWFGGFYIYNEGKDYCLEENSTWEILQAGNASPYHEMILRRMDKKEPHNIRLSLIRDTNVGTLVSRYGWSGMKCP